MSQVAVSWSGGKDSCFATYRALQQGFQVSHLLNMTSQEFKRSGGHGVHYTIMQLQSQAIGIPMLLPEFTRDDYEVVFKKALADLRVSGVTGLVTGDIHLQEGREWIERVCREVGVTPHLPLWGQDTGQLLADFVREGFRAVVVALQADLLDPSFLGRTLDSRFLADMLPLRDKVDPCGERGEFHTFVCNGPLFRREIRLLETKAVLRDGRWFLDIVRYELGP